MCHGCILGNTSVMSHSRELKSWPAKIGGA
jgi:hypothetical protein